MYGFIGGMAGAFVNFSAKPIKELALLASALHLTVSIPCPFEVVLRLTLYWRLGLESAMIGLRYPCILAFVMLKFCR